MSAKNLLHINDNDEVKPCSAKPGNCPYKHFDNVDDARSFIESRALAKTGEKSRSKSEMIFDERVLISPEGLYWGLEKHEFINFSSKEYFEGERIPGLIVLGDVEDNPLSSGWGSATLFGYSNYFANTVLDRQLEPGLVRTGFSPGGQDTHSAYPIFYNPEHTFLQGKIMGMKVKTARPPEYNLSEADLRELKEEVESARIKFAFNRQESVKALTRSDAINDIIREKDEAIAGVANSRILTQDEADDAVREIRRFSESRELAYRDKVARYSNLVSEKAREEIAGLSEQDLANHLIIKRASGPLKISKAKALLAKDIHSLRRLDKVPDMVRVKKDGTLKIDVEICDSIEDVEKIRGIVSAKGFRWREAEFSISEKGVSGSTGWSLGKDSEGWYAEIPGQEGRSHYPTPEMPMLALQMALHKNKDKRYAVMKASPYISDRERLEKVSYLLRVMEAGDEDSAILKDSSSIISGFREKARQEKVEKTVSAVEEKPLETESREVKRGIFNRIFG